MGLLKFKSWEFAIKLFDDEYKVPLLDPVRLVVNLLDRRRESQAVSQQSRRTHKLRCFEN
jgi:hypothetical protein